MGRRTGGSPPRYTTTKANVLVAATLLLAPHIQTATAIVYPSNHPRYAFNHLDTNAGIHYSKRSLSKRDNPIPLIVTNTCGDTIWPGIATQHGDAPDLHGFPLAPGETKNLTVGPDWQGRVWGRTNCTTSGDTASCMTGDCFGKMNCEYGGKGPATLAEFNLAGGTNRQQTFYDISLVDGYNLPLGLVYHPVANTSGIPPNIVNAACIGTAGYLNAPDRTGTYYTNASFPLPYEQSQTNEGIARWCPWDLQVFPPEKPGDGIYPYPDDNIQRPIFDPCNSACAATNAPSDCCTGDYHDPNVCKPGDYSKHAKAVCPDAYSFAFDDQTSTFIIPSGGGWEVVFCPEGRSTNILDTFGPQLRQLAASGRVTDDIKSLTMNKTFIESTHSSAAGLGKARGFACVVAAAAAGFLL